MDNGGKVKPTRKEAEKKAFWKRALTVAGAVAVTVLGVIVYRKRSRLSGASEPPKREE